MKLAKMSPRGGLGAGHHRPVEEVHVGGGGHLEDGGHPDEDEGVHGALEERLDQPQEQHGRLAHHVAPRQRERRRLRRVLRPVVLAPAQHKGQAEHRERDGEAERANVPEGVGRELREHPREHRHEAVAGGREAVRRGEPLLWEALVAVLGDHK